MTLPMDPGPLLILIAVGAVAGWLAGLVTRGRGLGLLGNIVVGVIGAYIGTWVLRQVGFSFRGMLGVWGDAIATAFLGAVLLLVLIGVLKKI
jgi:uncharacterized membrane protein YeaQ/YmgE (transglycosylase-associated protein family)